ncbi:MAG: tetrahydromethanopterin S-methyltransferase subunit H family protein [Candidatus Odinarchaeia archaeon]
MWKFKVNQKTFQIGATKVGGVPGERPVALIGTIFYLGHKILKDPEKGEFDKSKAEELIIMQDEYSDKTGNPALIDLVISGPEAVFTELDFVLNVTDTPILLDLVGDETKKAALQYVEEAGIQDKVVYNSINAETKEEELESIRNSKIKSAIILAFGPKVFTTDTRVSVAKEVLNKALEIGIDKPLLDTYILDIPSLGMGCKALFQLKNELGYPVGGGTDNAVSTWRGLKTKMGKQAKQSCVASAAVAAVTLGADFVLYGPIESAPYVFPAVSMIDAALEQLALESGAKLDRTLPIFRIA